MAMQVSPHSHSSHAGVWLAVRPHPQVAGLHKALQGALERFLGRAMGAVLRLRAQTRQGRPCVTDYCQDCSGVCLRQNANCTTLTPIILMA